MKQSQKEYFEELAKRRRHLWLFIGSQVFASLLIPFGYAFDETNQYTSSTSERLLDSFILMWQIKHFKFFFFLPSLYFLFVLLVWLGKFPVLKRFFNLINNSVKFIFYLLIIFTYVTIFYVLWTSIF